ncbi:uncharacterized protein IL334_004240 [Kwoniella shivajii]|uniref:Zn(2)-C6 fungal-type domain-containing protein n=1 Tax=Kwoniella shivajii TaxID=564305 RepID=A0ABZ1D0D8_9TREE|nr:hypothetical protein IL334_004240 [Kwoniella shivajii]
MSHSSEDAEAGPSRWFDAKINSSTDTVNGNDTPTIRTARACSSCSQQKLKCNGAKPCLRCINNGFPDSCMYLPSLRGRMRGKRKAPGTTDEHLDRPIDGNKGEPNITGNDEYTNIKIDDSFGMLPPEKPTLDYVRWKRNSLMPQIGPKNSSIWVRDGAVRKSFEETSSDVNHPSSRSKSMDSGYSPSSFVPPHINRNDSPVARKNFASRDTGDVSSTNPHPSTIIRAHSARQNSPVADRLTSLPLPGDRNPLAMLAEASYTVSITQADDHVSINPSSKRRHDERSKTQAEDGYYAPISRTLKDEAPHIMTLINVSEAEKLFESYFEYLHPHLPLLDPSHSSPSAVARRNNFLFNAICCVSARATNPILWSRLAEFARFEMERLPKEKNIDVVQGHLIYATWNLHRPKHFEMDMTWLRAGLAVRTAIDINLHRIVLLPQAREGLPQWVTRAIARTWLGAYITDRTMSAQLGKPSAIRGERSFRLYIALLRQPCQDKMASSSIAGVEPRHVLDDLWIAALAEWTQLLAQSIEAFRAEAEADKLEHTGDPNLEGLGYGTGHVDLGRASIRQLRSWRQHTEESIRSTYDVEDWDNTNVTLRNIRARIKLYQQYAELVVHSFVLESSAETSPYDLPVVVIELQKAATRVIQSYHTSFDTTSETRLGCPDMMHTFVTYAIVSLLRILQPQFAHLDPNAKEVLDIASSAADMLSRAVAANDNVPDGHSIFLTKLIDAKSAQLANSLSSGSRSQADISSSIPPLGGLHHEGTNQVVEPHNRVLPPKMMDFEAFGDMLNQDQGRSVWPPLPSSGTNAFSAYLDSVLPVSSEELNQSQPYDADLSRDDGSLSKVPDFPLTSTSIGTDSMQPNMTVPHDVRSWVALQMGSSHHTETTISPSIGLPGSGGLESLYTQENFWRNLLDGIPIKNLE